MFEPAFIWFCKTFGKPLRSPASDELKDALSLLKWKVSADEIVGAGKAAMVGLAAVIAFVAVLSTVIHIDPLVIVLLVPIAVLSFYAVTEWPKAVARERMLAALGEAPHLIAQIAIPLKQKPNIEHALAFVSAHADGVVADDMREVAWKSVAGKISDPIEGIKDVGKKWGKWSSGLQRSFSLIAASFHESDIKKKNAMLDASVSTVFEDMSTKTKEYTQSLNMPTLVLFSIGMVLPLMMVSLFPLMSMFGVGAGPGLLGAFLAVSIAASYVYSNSILRKRPPMFSRPVIAPSKQLKIGSRSVSAVPAAIVIGILAAVPGVLYLLAEGGVVLSGPLAALSAIGTIIILWAAAIAGSVYCYGTAHAASSERKATVELEDGFVDGIVHVRNRLGDGRPLEDAVEFAASLSSGKAELLFSALAEKMRRTSKSFERAVSELETPSHLVKNTLSMLAASVQYGLTATTQTATVIVAYLKRVKSMERELVLMLQRSLSMMKATAITFAPVVCAIIVVLFQMITKTVQQAQQQFEQSGGDTMGLLQTNLSPELLQLIVGLYSLALNFVLLRYVSRMQNGPDTVPFRMEMAKALPLAMILFTVTLIAARMFLSGSM